MMMLDNETFHQHVIYINFHASAQLILKKLIHQKLVGGPRVLQPEWHYCVIVGCFISDERLFLLIFEVQWNLVVPLKSV